jgi:hypothetical protein
MSIDVAYTQLLFMFLKKNPVTVNCVNSAYRASGSLMFLLNWEMIRKLPLVSILAIVSWCVIEIIRFLYMALMH